MLRDYCVKTCAYSEIIQIGYKFLLVYVIKFVVTSSSASYLQTRDIPAYKSLRVASYSNFIMFVSRLLFGYSLEHCDIIPIPTF